jgi:hypothetical protein
MKHPSATSAITLSAEPTPIPAFAPVERPLSKVFESMFVDVGLEVADVEEDVVCVVEVDCVETVVENDIEVDEAVTEPTNTGATVTLLLGSLQQYVVSPQHQVVELAVPSQGVTRTSVV